MKSLVTTSLLLAILTSSALSQSVPQVPAGFKATIIATGLEGPRHITVTRQGGVYVKLSRLKDGKGIIYLKRQADGAYVQQLAFGNYPGSGIIVKGNYLYASSNDAVYRYLLNSKGEPADTAHPDKIVGGLLDHKRDNAKSLALDNGGHIYVVVGSYSDACLLDPNSKKAPNPCPILDSAAGIWQFNAAKLNQQYKDGVKYITGFKNVVGLSWNGQTNSLFIMQHGRGDLYKNFPQYYSAEQEDLLPAETMYNVHAGADGGWPYAYYDQYQKKQILAPEYGGDGKKSATHKALQPLVAFPAHLGPNGLMFYTGQQFPAKYRQGAFIAFHGKSKELNKGYFVAFVPLKNGKPSGKWEPFAENFTVGNDIHRPCGLAQGEDGALYVTDDTKGTVYRIGYGK